MSAVLRQKMLHTYCVWKVVLEQTCQCIGSKYCYQVSSITDTWFHVTGLNSLRNFFLVALFLAFLCIESGVTYLPPGVEFMPYRELKELYFFM